jgi:hypothetical protein
VLDTSCAVRAIPKSRIFGWSGLGDHDVARLEIAMDDAVLVRMRDGIGDGGDQQELLPQGQSVRTDVLVESLPAHQLHREVGLAAVLRLFYARLVDLGDSWMVEAAEQLALELEPAD